MDFKVPKGLPVNIERFINDPTEREWTGPFSFVLGADPQFGMIGTVKLGKSEPTSAPEIILTRQTIQHINAMNPKPKFFVICGDMLDALPFEKSLVKYYNNNDIVQRDRQYQDFVKVFKEMDPEIKLIFVCGNHDVGDVPTKETLEKYRNEFGPDYFTFWVGGVKFVVLNSQYFFSPEAVPEETEKHLRFMEEKIADPKAKHIVIFQHIPFFGSHPEEDTSYCNINRDRRLELMEKLYKLGVRHIFCGHCHRNAGGHFKDMGQVVTSAMGAPFGADPSGFRVIQVGQDEITHEYVKLRETTDCTEFHKCCGGNADIVESASEPNCNMMGEQDQQIEE